MDHPVEGIRPGYVDTLPELMAVCDGRFHELAAMFRNEDMQKEHLDQVTIATDGFSSKTVQLKQ